MRKQGFIRIAYIFASLLLVLICAAGCLEIDYSYSSSATDSLNIIDIFSDKEQTSSKKEESSKAATSSNVSVSSGATTSEKTEISSNAKTSSEEINFYNSGVLPPDETSSEREIIFYNSGVYVEDETDENSGRIVYDTPTGKKYHFSKKCAGKNAIEVLYDEIKHQKEPCKKCVK